LGVRRTEKRESQDILGGGTIKGLPSWIGVQSRGGHRKVTRKKKNETRFAPDDTKETGAGGVGRQVGKKQDGGTRKKAESVKVEGGKKTTSQKAEQAGRDEKGRGTKHAVQLLGGVENPLWWGNRERKDHGK